MTFASLVEQVYDEYSEDYSDVRKLPEYVLYELALAYVTENELDQGEITCQPMFGAALRWLGRRDEALAGYCLGQAVINEALQPITEIWDRIAELRVPGPTTREELSDDRWRDEHSGL